MIATRASIYARMATWHPPKKYTEIASERGWFSSRFEGRPFDHIVIFGNVH
jgi:hypothetical protein